MTKVDIKLGAHISELMSLCYSNIKASQEYARAIYNDPNVHRLVKSEFLNLSGSLATMLDRLDRRIPPQSQEAFRIRLKENDHLRLENIKAVYQRLTPEQQELVEETVLALAKGEIIEFLEDGSAN